MTRFVIVGTSRRGAVRPHEVLDEAGQAEAFSRVAEDVSRDVRVVWETDHELLTPRRLGEFMKWGTLEPARRRKAV